MGLPSGVLQVLDHAGQWLAQLRRYRYQLHAAALPLRHIDGLMCGRYLLSVAVPIRGVSQLAMATQRHTTVMAVLAYLVNEPAHTTLPPHEASQALVVCPLASLVKFGGSWVYRELSNI